ncbi:MAG: sugar ABC transporter permease [Lachnospiraceae bacterium]|nr:sugar ABC transporter permease [Lachnospiraceae bacterium]
MKKKGFSYAKWGYIFSIPFVVVFCLAMLYPIMYTLVIGFTEYRGALPTLKALSDPFKNYKTVLSEELFRRSLKTTFSIWLWNFIPQIGLALILAAWFTDDHLKLKGKGFFKVVFYMPNIITAATIALLFSSLFQFPKGVINDILLEFKMIDEAYNFAVDPKITKGVISFIQFWMWFGYTMIVLISGILGISPDIFEAADIDGANGFQKFVFVTLPNIKTIMLYTLVTSMIGGLQMFDIPHLYSDGGPNNATRTAAKHIYAKGFSGAYLYDEASAASVILFIIIIILSAILFFLMRDKDAAILEKQKRQMEKKYRQEYKAQVAAQKAKLAELEKEAK